MKIQVIKNGNRYFSSYLGNRQHIYAFSKEEPLIQCTRFINEYRRMHSKFPPADSSSATKLFTLKDETEVVHTETKDMYEFHRLCLTYNVGLAIIDSFKYDFSDTDFTVKVAAAETMEDISKEERVDLLNYAFMLNDDSERRDQDYI